MSNYKKIINMFSILVVIISLISCDVASNNGGNTTIKDPSGINTTGNQTANAEVTYAYAWAATNGNLNGPVDPSMSNILPMVWLTNNPISTAVQLLNSRPAGHRIMFLTESQYRNINTSPGDNCIDPTSGALTSYRSIWWDNGVADSKSHTSNLFQQFNSLGGKVDMLVLDTEQELNNWNISSTPQYSWSALQNDPRMKNIFPQLGFTDLSTVQNWGPDNHYLIWNNLMMQRTANYIDEAVYNNLKALYPNVKGCDYKYYNYSKQFPFYDQNGHDISYSGNGAVVGTNQTFALYGEFGGVRQLKLNGQSTFDPSAYNDFLFTVNQMRSMKLSSDNPVSPWIAARSKGSTNYVPFVNTDYYQEMLFHVLLTGPDGLLFFNDKEFTTLADNQIVSETLKEFDQVAGYSGKKTLVKNLVPWGSDFVLTGMIVNGQKVWRFTPSVDVNSSASSTLVQSSTPVKFKTNQATIVFPDGTLYKPSNPVSNKGFWIIQPSTASDPVITSTSGGVTTGIETW